MLDDLAPADLVLLEPDILDAITTYATVLANINTDWCDRILADSSPLTASARTVLLEYAHRVHIAFEMSPSERHSVQRQFPGVPLAASIAESLVGGQHVLRRYDEAEQANSDGHALACAAVDARRAGIHRGLLRDRLAGLFRHVRGMRRSRKAFHAALSWATEVPDGASVAVLNARREDSGGGWSALGYLAAADEGHYGHPAREIPADFWTALLGTLPPNDVFHLAVAAHLRGQHHITHAALEKATSSDKPAIARYATTAVKRLNT